MQSKREQVRAHNFQARRMVRAVLTGNPDHREQPFQRSATGTLAGMILSLLILAGFAIYGLLHPALGPALDAETTMVVEKDTGTRYLVDGGTLRPVANLTSALLLAGPDLKTQSLSRQRTRSLPRGETIGIVGAPEDIPRAGDVVAAGWSICVPATTATTGIAPATTISFLAKPRPTALAQDKGLLVAGPDGSLYLVMSGTRFQITTTAARNALGYSATVPLRATSTWLASLKPGRAITVLSVEGAGESGPTTNDGATKVGQVLAVHQGLVGTQYFLVQRGKIVPVTPFEALLLMGNPRLASVYPDRRSPRVVPETAIAEASRQLLPASLGWPESPPAPLTATGQSVCVAAGPDGSPWIGTAPLPGADGQPAAPASPSSGAGAGAGNATADGGTQVMVPPGSGVLAEETNAAGGSSGALWFVADAGRRFSIPTADALSALGLQAAARVKVPASVLGAIPQGPVLDIAAAGQPVASAVAPKGQTGGSKA